MNWPFPQVNPLTPERVRALCEMFFWDGFYKGAVLGLLAGVVVGIVVARLLREERGSNGA